MNSRASQRCIDILFTCAGPSNLSLRQAVHLRQRLEAQKRPSSSLRTGHSFLDRCYATAAAKKPKPATSTSPKIPINVGKKAPSPTARKNAQPLTATSPTAPKTSTCTINPKTLKAKAPGPGVIQQLPKPTKAIALAENNSEPENLGTAKTTEEQLAEIEQLMNLSHFFPTADPWGQRIETMDVQIPYKSSFDRKEQFFNLSSMWEQKKYSWQNAVKNASSMWRLATANAFPGHDLTASLRQKIFKWPVKVFQSGSVQPDAWLSDLRVIALDTYKSVNEGVAKGDIKVIKSLTTGSYLSNILSLVRNRNRANTYTWKLHKLETPVRVVSIRAMDGYMAKEEPRVGNRLVVHALVKFDTVQSLRIQNARRQVLQPSGEVSPGGMVPQRNVVEYLVFEKRMWYDSPWVIRDQLYERSGRGKVAS